MASFRLPALLLLVFAAAATAATPSSDSNARVDGVHTVHVVFSHHLDVGLNEALRFVGFCRGFATKIVQEYFDDFIPRAIRIARETNSDPRNDRFSYTIHPWIASLYVDCVPWEIEDGCPLSPGKLVCPSGDDVKASGTL